MADERGTSPVCNYSVSDVFRRRSSKLPSAKSEREYEWVEVMSAPSKDIGILSISSLWNWYVMSSFW